MKKVITILSVMSALLLFGCRHNSVIYPESLLTADSLATFGNPDSAVTLLNELAPQMASAADPVRHYFELLTIKARDKAYLPFESDSIVFATAEYFENGGDLQHLPEAYYYAGRYLSDLGDAPQALEYFQKAIDVIESKPFSQFSRNNSFRTNKLLGLLYAQSGYLFMKQHLYDDARDKLQMAYHVDSINQDTTGMAASLMDIGQTWHVQSQYEEALICYRKCKQISRQNKDSVIIKKALFQEIHTLVVLQKIDEARTLFLNNVNNPANLKNPTFCSIIGNMYSVANEIDSAQYFISKSLNGSLAQKAHAHIWLANNEADKGYVKSAINHIKDYILLTNTINGQQEVEATALTNSLYNYSLRVKENLILKHNNEQYKSYLVIFSLVGAFLILTLCWVLNIIHQNKKKESLRQVHQLLYKQTFGLKWNLSTSCQMIKERIKNQKTLNNQDWIDIESQITELDPNFINKLRSIHAFNEIEWHVTLLVKLQLPLKDISILTCNSLSNVTMIRIRLIQKVFARKGSAKEWDDFILSM